ncbi:scytonemin biosynthesis PEP-CTERM protein ScyF [Chrysosporum bergii ANA360D]|jgi:DNA-binding beta-propeller fold protein YncE|uniref:Scytonemin biosynthesis PEP-CTERM protein ScyF n=1 Tax=Chrysosporum bergii ANA360D TaxID=617107 RepID=A0AA43GUF1_9CYAN|nr:scytonemin biosynthesis PEP-CTERM protein ScyF [Chrysosporum bergii]MDH6061866.1 scytonemin biosynthesis PEP-CTERM protein ScyF [Chrysosporum bergii ANA360D]
MALVKKLSMALASAGLITLTATSPAAALNLKYETSIGRPATFTDNDFPGVPGVLTVPQGIGVEDSTGNIFVSNGRGIDRVDVFDSQGNYIKGIGSTGTGPGEFDEPADLRFNPITGDLHVGDVFNSRINVFDAQGNYKTSYGSFSGPVEDRLFFGPGGMDFDAAGNLYVSDFSADVIKVYNPQGEQIKTIGSPGSEPGQFSGPGGLIISDTTGKIYVNDQYNGRVQVLDPEGNFLFAFGSTGSEPGQFKEPIGIDVDEYENIYVADSQNSRVQVFDANGNFLTSFGEPTRDANGDIVPPPTPPALGGTTPYGDPIDLEPGKFNWTAGLHYNDDKIYVGDFFQGRIQVLEVERTARVPEPTALLGLGLFGLGSTVVKLRRNRLRNSN